MIGCRQYYDNQAQGFALPSLMTFTRLLSAHFSCLLWSLWRAARPLAHQLCVIGKRAEGTLCPIIQLINEDVKQERSGPTTDPWAYSLGDTQREAEEALALRKRCSAKVLVCFQACLVTTAKDSAKCSPAREDQGTSWRGLAHCICSVGENKREFSVAFHPMFAPSLPGSAGTNGPTEPASSCPEGGLGPPLLCDDEDGAAYHVRILVGYCSNRGVPQHGGGQEAKASSTLPPQAHRFVFGIADSLAVAVLSLQRRLSTGNSTLKEVVTLKKERLCTILFLMTLAALAGAYCGTSLLVWMLQAKNVPQVLLGQPAADLRSLRSMLAVWGQQSQEVQQLRDEVAHLAAEMAAVKKEAQQMREAMSASTRMSDWALKRAGAAIDLQRSSSISAWLCKAFWFLCSPPLVDTFVQPDASPGYCWPFQGFWSEVLIRLPTEIRPLAIIIEHTSKTASPPGTVSSAPRDFTVYGLDEEGKEETLLGTFTYTVQKGPTQTFPLQNGIPRAFRVLKLGIQSNWGKPGYICIYRVQVCGKMVGTNAIGVKHVETFPQ
ncbi:uncharacterized protein LOC126036226 [Accipiter gentilis]|uniref:uncharacterized protein LOC126036226 n=1 Tax=Astur gentilis TaxID=8957 RepID=UPI002110D1AA|nr:uncharacterized protein LOC126036226 [Accipiter gentilis]